MITIYLMREKCRYHKMRGILLHEQFYGVLINANGINNKNTRLCVKISGNYSIWIKHLWLDI